MNYLKFIHGVTTYNSTTQEVQFLVSGNDQLVRKTVLRDVLQKCRYNGEKLIIVDTGIMNRMDYDEIRNLGYQMKNGISEKYCIYNPFKITTVKELSKFRQMLSTLEYDEKEKGKLIAYLNFIRYMEYLECGGYDSDITINKLAEYSTIMAIEEKLQNMSQKGIIDEKQQMILLSKYSECSSAAADFEDKFVVLLPFISGESLSFNSDFNQVLFFPIRELGEDEVIRKLVIQLLQFSLEEYGDNKTTLLVFDKGYGSCEYIFRLLKDLPSQINMHIFSEDIFTLCDASVLSMVFNRFTARVYSRHCTMSSAEAIEKVCGEIDVVKNTYHVTYDRRWRANRLWDILMGNNKTEAYTQTAPIREPRYRKEMIMSLRAGQYIVEYMGNTSLFTV